MSGRATVGALATLLLALATAPDVAPAAPAKPTARGGAKAPPKSGARPRPLPSAPARGRKKAVARQVPAAADYGAPPLDTASAGLRRELLDDFGDAAVWQAVASDRVRATLRRDLDGSLCLDYDFGGVAGQAAMRRELPLDWPARFELATRLKSTGAVNDFQLTLFDAPDQPAWRFSRPDATGGGAGGALPVLPTALDSFRIRSRDIGPLHGPAHAPGPGRTRLVELGVAAGRDGGKGALCLARLALVERLPEPAPGPAPRTRVAGGVLEVDFGALREFNGVVLHWPDAAAGSGVVPPRARAGRRARPVKPAPGLHYDLLASDDGLAWRTLRRVRAGDGGMDALFVPESEARQLRIGLPAGVAPPRVELRTAAQWPDLDHALAESARALPRGDVPRTLLGEPGDWTLVGVDAGGDRSGLLSADGAIEVGPGGFSIEPALLLDGGQRLTWADVGLRQGLRDGQLALPVVHWVHPAVELDIEAGADGTAAAPELLARYALRNPTARAQTVTLLLVLRPWAVDPLPSASAAAGRASRVRMLRFGGRELTVNEQVPLHFTEAPANATALPLDGGLSLAALVAAPPLAVAGDAQSHASAALAFRVTLAPGERRTLGWSAPLGTGAGVDLDAAQLDARLQAVASSWRARLDAVEFTLPDDDRRIADTLRTAWAHILLSRNGPALQPGTRGGARSGLRVGAPMAAALLRLGEPAAAREFVDWVAGFVPGTGQVPCCVDARGVDPSSASDSPGQYLFMVAEVWRHTGDLAFVQRHWPTVQRVLGWMEAQRQGERGDANRVPARAWRFGLMPPSGDRSGRADKPACAPGDDFWALRGYQDAVVLASAIGDGPLAARWSTWRDEFERDLVASLQARSALCGPGLLDGFEASGALPGQSGVGALARQGLGGRALARLDSLFKGPAARGWNPWAEGVRPDAGLSADYILSALDLFAFEHEARGGLVLGAGFRPAWLHAAGGVGVQGLPTRHGALHYRLQPQAQGWRLVVDKPMTGLRSMVLRWPGDGPLPSAWHDGLPLDWHGRELALPAPPFVVDLHGAR